MFILFQSRKKFNSIEYRGERRKVSELKRRKIEIEIDSVKKP